MSAPSTGLPPDPPAPPAERLSRAELVAQEIERQIVGAALPDGSRLGTKEDLRRRHNVAAGTVNEAVRLLKTRGLVELKPGPGGGLVVRQPPRHLQLSHLVLQLRDEDDGGIADCLAVRNALEERVALDAAAHCSDADLDELRALLETMARRRDDPRAALRVNWDLHRRLAEIGPNVVLRAIYTTLLDTIERSVEGVSTDPAFEPERNLRVHRALVEAIASRDPARVRRAVRRHMPAAGAAAAGGG